MDLKILDSTPATPLLRTDHTSPPPEAILDAAFRTFAARGYRAVHLEEGANAAGMTKGAIYHSFDGKEDLLWRAVRMRHGEVLAEIEEALEAQLAPVAAQVRFLLRRAW